MADNKKSFLAYADWYAQFNLLSNEEAGVLIKHILSYVNDENPNLPDDARIIKIAFEPIKLQLKRDLKKYENAKQEKATNGIIGNLKRWHLDLYEKYIKKQITLEQAVNIASTRKESHSDSTQSPPIANIADTVNDSVTVNDTDTVIMCENSEKASPTPTHFQSLGRKPISILKENCTGYSEWLNTISKKNQLLPNQVFDWLDAFELHLLGSGKTEETEQEFKRYFNSWVTSEIRQGRKPKVENQSKDAPKKTAEQIAFETLNNKYGNSTYEN